MKFMIYQFCIQITNCNYLSEHITVNRKCLRKLETSHRASPVVIWNSANFTVFLDNNVDETISTLSDSMKEISAVTVSYFGVEMVLNNDSGNLWVSFDHLSGSFATGNLLRNGLKLFSVFLAPQIDSIFRFHAIGTKESLRRGVGLSCTNCTIVPK